jgi:hypothetical protein
VNSNPWSSRAVQEHAQIDSRANQNTLGKSDEDAKDECDSKRNQIDF